MAKRHSSRGAAAPSPALDINLEVARLQGMTVKQLRERFVEIFGEATNSKNRIWLIRRIAWRMQANVYGGLAVTFHETGIKTLAGEQGEAA